MELTKHWAAQLDDYVIDLAWSPDGALLAAASGAGPVRLLDAAGAPLHELPGHEAGTNVIGWNPPESGNPLLATCGQDGAVKFWDGATGQHTATARLGAGWVEHLAWSKNLLAAALGRKLFLLNPDGSVRHAFPEAPKTITALAWRGPPAKPVLAVAFFGGVRLIEAGDFSLWKEFPYGNGIQALVWSPDAKWLVSGNQDPSVHLWIPDEGAELQMSGYELKVKHLAFDHTSRWLATGGGHDACLWDCAGAGPEGRTPAMLPHEKPVSALAFQQSHGLLASAAADGTVMLWSPERKQPLRATVKMPHAPTRLAWSPDDRLLAIGSEKGAVYVLKSEG
jgi:WD40 repeat protein